jgi:NADPH-dependent 2,4-dienoyl-CoA reductase/sulfur reductase-like enzyme
VKRVVVVGGSLAGVNAIEELRARGYDGQIVLVSAETGLPYTRPPLSKEALATGTSLDALALRGPGWFDDRGVDLQLGRQAIGLDTRDKRVLLDSGTAVPFDGLVLATGSTPVRPNGFHTPNTHELRTFDDAQRLRARLASGGHLVVLGAGFIGMETAATARGMGLDVTVVEMAPVPMFRAFPTALGQWFVERHADNGVRVLCSTSVLSLQDVGSQTRVRLSTGEVLVADVVLAGLGTKPSTTWLDGSSVAVGDGVMCEPNLMTNVPGIVAAGDVARWSNSVFGESMRIEHWTNAVEQGAHAAAALLGEQSPFGSVPFFWTDQYNLKLRCVGRPLPHDRMATLAISDTSYVAVFGRGGLVSGAVCVNAPRQLATLRQAVADRTPFEDMLPADTPAAATSAVPAT